MIMLSNFHMSIGYSQTFFVKYIFKSFAHFNWANEFLSFQEFLTYSRYRFLVKYMNCTYFHPVFGLPFYFL